MRATFPWLTVALAVSTAFTADLRGLFSGKDWNDGKAEILTYAVIRPYRGDTLRESATWISESGFYQPSTGLFARKAEPDWVGAFQAVLRRNGEAEGMALSALAVLQWDKAKPDRWWQKVSLHGVYGAHWRRVSREDGRIVLRSESSGGEASKTLEDLKPPFLTEEMLFTYLRAFPQKRGRVEEVWLLDSQLSDAPTYQAQYAKIEVIQESAMVRELSACHIRVIRDDGKRHEFWMHRQGLHPVVQARLADGSEWSLQGWERKKYWSF